MTAVLFPNDQTPAPRMFAVDVPEGWQVRSATRTLVTITPERDPGSLVPTISISSGLAPAGTDLHRLGRAVANGFARAGTDAEIEDGRIGSLNQRRVYVQSLTSTSRVAGVRVTQMFATGFAPDDDVAGDVDAPRDVFTVACICPEPEAADCTVPFLAVAASLAIGPRLVPPPQRTTTP